jgi:flagellar hook-associated protein 2
MPTVGGIISGIDTNSIIKQLLDAARTPIRAMQRNISGLEGRKSKLQDLNGLLSDLRTALDAVNEGDELSAYSISTNQPSSLGALVTGEPLTASYDVTVISEAESTIVRSNGFASPTDELVSGTLTLIGPDGTVEVPISDADGTRSLEGLAAYINDNVDDVVAYVLDTGVSGDPFKLMIQGRDTGAEHDFTTSVSYSGGNGTELTMTTQQSAVDAELDIDGQQVFTPSNTAVGLLPGITLDIKGPTTGSAKISVTQDTTAMVSNVQAVVDAYNKLNDFFAKNTGTLADASIRGDQTLRTVQRRVQQVMSSGYSFGNIAGLNSLGLGTAQDGTLEFDSSKFTTMLASEFDDVVGALSDGGLFDDLFDAIDAVIDPVTGIFAPRMTSIDKQIESLNDSILVKEARIGLMETSLRAQFTAMEAILAKYQATGDMLAAQIAASFTS